MPLAHEHCERRLVEDAGVAPLEPVVESSNRLAAFLGTMALTGSALDVERQLLIAFDLLLVLVLGLLLYAVSARDPMRPPGLFDHVQLGLVLAALGENLVLLVNLAWSAWLYQRFVRARGPYQALERLQTWYLPAFPAWAAVVVVFFPPLLGFV